MKIIYMGTPEFAVPPLESLILSEDKPILVVSQPDAKRDRGKKLKPTPVKEKALEYGIPVEQPEKLRGNIEFLQLIRNLEPDLIVVAAYGKILPAELLEIPTKGCINIHGSLLPKYRGAAPVQRAIQNGDILAGVTLMQMAEGMDTGDMLARVSTTTEGKTTAMLLDELSKKGAALLINTLPLIKNNQLEPIPQDEKESTYAKMIHKQDGLVDFTKPAIEIERQIRAMNPWPVAFTFYQGQPMKIWQANVRNIGASETPGTISQVSSEGILVATGQGMLNITEIQMPGKKKMSVSDYIRGNNIEIKRLLG